MAHSAAGGGGGQPLVVSLNCLDDPSLEQELLAGVEHVSLFAVALDRDVASPVPRLPAARRAAAPPPEAAPTLPRLPDCAVGAAAAANRGLRLVHVDANRAEEVADTMAENLINLIGLLNFFRKRSMLHRRASDAAYVLHSNHLSTKSQYGAYAVIKKPQF